MTAIPPAYVVFLILKCFPFLHIKPSASSNSISIFYSGLTCGKVEGVRVCCRKGGPLQRRGATA